MNTEISKKLSIENFEVYYDSPEEAEITDIEAKFNFIECSTYYILNGNYYNYFYRFIMACPSKINILEKLNLSIRYKEIFQNVSIKHLIERYEFIMPVTKEEIPEDANINFKPANLFIIFHDLKRWLKEFEEVIEEGGTTLRELEDEGLGDFYNNNSNYHTHNENSCPDYKIITSAFIFSGLINLNILDDLNFDDYNYIINTEYEYNNEKYIFFNIENFCKGT